MYDKNHLIIILRQTFGLNMPIIEYRRKSREVFSVARGTNQKFKFSYLMQIMQEKTDDEHAITMPQIMEELEKQL